MGYTHYYETKSWSDADAQGFMDALPHVQDILKRYENIVRFESDSDDAVVADEKSIRFNGILEDGHETFMFSNHQDGFNFCKTAYKPYDIVVCEVLLVLNAKMPSLKVSSDGGMPNGDTDCEENWTLAAKNVLKLYGIDSTAVATATALKD